MQNIWEGCFNLIAFLETIEFPCTENGVLIWGEFSKSFENKDYF